MEIEKLGKYLVIYDSIDISEEYYRRTAFKPLYDYYMALTLYIATEYCRIEKKNLSPWQLKVRWDHISNFIPDLSNWEKIINPLSNLRKKIEHDDEFIPKEKELNHLRQSLGEFEKWIHKEGKKVDLEQKMLDPKFISIDKSRGNFLRLKLFILNQLNSQENLNEFGHYEPFDTELSDAINLKYTEMVQYHDVVKNLHNNFDNLQQQDIITLMNFNSAFQYFEGIQYVLENAKICPNCFTQNIEHTTGEQIIDDEKDQFYDEPISYCKNCNYYESIF